MTNPNTTEKRNPYDTAYINGKLADFDNFHQAVCDYYRTYINMNTAAVLYATMHRSQ